MLLANGVAIQGGNRKEGGWLRSLLVRANHRKDVMAQNTQVCENCGTVNLLTAVLCAKCLHSLAKKSVYTTALLNSNNTFNGAIILPTTSTLIAGNIVRSRYRILEMVNKGSFSTVYKAIDEQLPSKPVVAIKEMSNSQLSPSEKAKAHLDFHNEASLLVQLKHPNLPDVSDFFEVGEKVYLVMEFIEGKTLAKVQVEQNGPLDERLVMGWAMQLCTVLHYLHAQPHPIIFRVMNPTNVMVTANGEIKLIDFGIAEIFNNRDVTLLGLWGYAPLEQYSRGQSDARSDIYALGATLYNLLTKEVPIHAPS